MSRNSYHAKNRPMSSPRATAYLPYFRISPEGHTAPVGGGCANDVFQLQVTSQEGFSPLALLALFLSKGSAPIPCTLQKAVTFNTIANTLPHAQKHISLVANTLA